MSYSALPPDASLVEACLRHDRKAQRLLYDRFAAKMLATCLRYCGNRADAEDCLLQGFEKVFRNLNTYQGSGSLEGWLRRIMVREALQHLRKRSLLFVQPKDDSPVEAQSPSWADAAEGLAIDDLLEAVASLPANFRTVFNLAIVEGFTHEEISNLLSITEATSRSQLFRARQQLQKILEAEAANLTKTHR